MARLSGRREKAVFILGAGRSGSTLLELILDSHSEIRGLGELNHLAGFLAESTRHSPRACAYCKDALCPFWNKSVDWAMLRRYYSHGGLASGIRRSWYHHVANPHLWFSRWSTQRILVDSTKAPSWIHRHLAYPRVWKKIEPMLLFLTRDGRAVANAVLRKHPNRNMLEVAQQWKSRMMKSEQLFESFRLGPALRISYEDLASAPELAVRRVCDWLHVDYESGMLDYWTHDHHMMGGNVWTRGRVQVFHGGDAQASLKTLPPKSSGTAKIPRPGNSPTLAIAPDERWRSELSTGDLKIFSEIAGDFNLRYLPNR